MQGIFVATFLIGLREGLEATLIVSIVAAFLKRNGHSLRPMFIGVGLAVVISIAVGVGLDLLSATLPQRQQEMLETVIGVIAIVFVTTMIIWMNRNASAMKGELESEAAQALRSGGWFAMATMAFLAVLKEGFETSVFLLAAIQADGGAIYGPLGAASGIGLAIVIGIAIYFGGVRINLGRFFRYTGVFLVLIAAGLVMTTLRTAHEAGWVNIGQQKVADFSGWMPPTSFLGALLTGMFGIQTDPRLIEVVGWFCYLIPVMVIFLWPRAWIPANPRLQRRLLTAGSAALFLLAILMATVIPASSSSTPGPTQRVTAADGRPVTVTHTGSGSTATMKITSGPTTREITLERAEKQTVDGLDVDVWQKRETVAPDQTSTQITLDQLLTLTGGRLPVGLAPSRTPGPFAVRWSASASHETQTHAGALVSAYTSSTRIATLTGGGLTGTKTVTVGALPGDWSTSTSDTQAVVDQILSIDQDRAERALWRVWMPIVIALAALYLAYASVVRGRPRPRSERKNERNEQSTAPQDENLVP